MFSQAMKHEKPATSDSGGTLATGEGGGGVLGTGEGDGDRTKDFNFLKGGTGVCDPLPTLHVPQHRKKFPLLQCSLHCGIHTHTHTLVKCVKITGRPGSEREDCIVRWCKKGEYSTQISPKSELAKGRSLYKRKGFVYLISIALTASSISRRCTLFMLLKTRYSITIHSLAYMRVMLLCCYKQCAWNQKPRL